METRGVHGLFSLDYFFLNFLLNIFSGVHND